jgi:signal transduction histidine kinase
MARAGPEYRGPEDDGLGRIAARLAEGAPAESVLAEAVRLRDEGLEAARRAGAAVDELRQFCAVVAHDLRGPLSSALGWAELLAEGYGAPGGAVASSGAGAEAAGHVVSATREVMRMLDGLVALARIGSAEIVEEPVDLSAAARRAAERLRRDEPGRDVLVEVEPGLRARADRRLAERLMEELVRNAWTFTRPRQGARIRVYHPPGGEPGVAVADDGVGGDPERADRLFLPFGHLGAAPDLEGLGVGLAACRRIVARHGGAIRATPGSGGMTVVASLPGRGA